MIRGFKKKKIVFILGITICMIPIAIVSSSTKLNVVSYELVNDKITNGFRMVLLSDFHSCSYGEHQSILLDEIKRQEPDVVLLTGDIFDDNLPQKNAKELLSALSNLYPCFYVSGNHEFRSGEIVQMKQMIRDNGIFVLEGTGVPFEVNGQTITIFGIDDPDVGDEIFEHQLKECGKNVGKNQFSLLLSHRPERIDEYQFYGFDLVLSGHAHGGQWRIPGVLNGLLAPHQGFFPQYAGGLYQLEDSSMIVSRGLAKESTRVPRIFNQPELVVIHMIPRPECNKR
jgi:predicted MPP superfamily phosphohydrolase